MICKNERCGASFDACDARPPAPHLCPKCRRLELKAVARENLEPLHEWVDELLSAGAKLPDLFGMMIVASTGLKIECAVGRRTEAQTALARFPFVQKAIDTVPRDGHLILYVQRDEDALILSVPIGSKEKQTVVD